MAVEGSSVISVGRFCQACEPENCDLYTADVCRTNNAEMNIIGPDLP